MIRNQLQLNSRFYAITAMLGIAVLTTGCSKTDPRPASVLPVVAPVAKQLVKPVLKPSSSAIKLVPSSGTNQFDFSSKKDPFKPLVIAKAVTALTPSDLKKSLHDGLPIHSFDVSQFRLIGIVTGAKENQAMVVDPNGKGYVLKAGMSIGKNDGRITAISNAGVDVLEQFKDDNGRVRKENIRITLPKKQ